MQYCNMSVNCAYWWWLLLSAVLRTFGKATRACPALPHQLSLVQPGDPGTPFVPGLFILPTFDSHLRHTDKVSRTRMSPTYPHYLH